MCSSDLLNYHLRTLEDADELKRVKRHKKGPRGNILFHTTLVILKRKATDTLKKLATWFRKSGMNQWSMQGFNLDAPASELQAQLISTFMKTTSQ